MDPSLAVKDGVFVLTNGKSKEIRTKRGGHVVVSRERREPC